MVLIFILEYFISMVTPERWPAILGGLFHRSGLVGPWGNLTQANDPLDNKKCLMNVLMVENLSQSYGGIPNT